MATGGTDIGTNSNFSGKRFNLDSLKTQSQETSSPVYADIRPIIAVSVLSAMAFVSLI